MFPFFEKVGIGKCSHCPPPPSEYASVDQQAGINRVSLGIQSLDDRTLELYNRDHSAAQARQSLEACLRYFQPSQVLDVIVEEVLFYWR